MTCRPRLLVLSHSYSVTGAPIALLNLVRGLTEDFDILVASPFEGPLRQHFMACGIHAIVAPNLDQDINISGALLLSFDAVLANTVLTCQAIHAAKQLDKPSIWYLHEGLAANEIVKEFPAIAPAFPLATRVVVPCSFSQQFYRPVRPDTEIVRYGIETREALPLPRANRPMRILQLGSIDPRKGQDIACAAWGMLRDTMVELHIVGNPTVNSDYRAEVLALSKNLPQVKFASAVDPAYTAALINRYDALVVPSRDEVTPLVILEAMAAAKPVIASAVGGIPEMIVDHQTGLLFTRDDARHLASLIDELAGDSALAERIGRTGQEFVRAHRTLEQYRDGFTRIVKEILEKKERTGI